MGPVIHSHLLRRELRQRREALGLTQAAVAKTFGWSSAKMIRLEQGTSLIDGVNLQSLLGKYGIADEVEVAHLQGLAQGAKQDGWWHKYKQAIPPNRLTYNSLTANLMTYAGYTMGATRILQAELNTVPELLQIPEYTKTYTQNVYGSGRAEAHLTANFLQQHQTELGQQPDPPEQLYVLDEAVLRCHVGIRTNPYIMPEQLLHLAERARDPHIEVAIVPFSTHIHEGSVGPGKLVELAMGLGSILYQKDEIITDNVRGGWEVEAYRHAFDERRSEALPPERSIDLITHIAETMLSEL